jgi:hypothetical protein
MPRSPVMGAGAFSICGSANIRGMAGWPGCAARKGRPGQSTRPNGGSRRNAPVPEAGRPDFHARIEPFLGLRNLLCKSCVLAPYAMRGHIELERDGAGSLRKASTA